MSTGDRLPAPTGTPFQVGSITELSNHQHYGTVYLAGTGTNPTPAKKAAKSHAPIRCFEGDAKPHEPFWKWTNTADVPTMEIDGVISEFSWWGDEITPKIFKDQLYEFGKGGPVTMKLSSPGGDPIAAAKMRTIMTEYPGDITVQVNGMAASAAVMVAISGKTLQMSDSSYMMIHDPAVVVFLAALDIETLSSLHDSLQSIKDGLILGYAAKTGLSETRISNMMTKETWMSAREAVDLGFADSIITGGQAAKKAITNIAYVNCLNSYDNLPQGVVDLTKADEPTEADIERAAKLTGLRERIQSIRSKGT